MICLFGGTFDPVHNGHLHAAETVVAALGVDEIRLVLSARPSHKDRTGASLEHRWAMLQLACADRPQLVPDDREIRRQRPSYTVETLEAVRAEAPDEDLAWVIGSDAFALLERFSGKLEEYQGNLLRSAHELAKEWRTDKVLRPLKSLMIFADGKRTLLISGTGEVIEPDDGVIGIGSGGAYAAASARALLQNTELSAEQIVEKSLMIAADLCVYTNQQICIEKLSPETS